MKQIYKIIDLLTENKNFVLIPSYKSSNKYSGWLCCMLYPYEQAVVITGIKLYRASNVVEAGEFNSPMKIFFFMALSGYSA